ncbi:TonB-dependent receptor [Parabacteroides sp. PF5-9]|uniref:SusC/RagA family TonB-linked outer membrane protein n=1 Tax=Parabacteroides sp. PF5-9 TaxID=1742404 RepID=UPI0024768030|nr:TonB-dependent receptor [Parabacteroides sp. PF5-9]MDH6358902.1 TonB-linked SusC/RagA family outer membrane protein [Parabacteroides sp. PF5-9]
MKNKTLLDNFIAFFSQRIKVLLKIPLCISLLFVFQSITATSEVNNPIIPQQGRTITVSVTDNLGPVIGANVMVKGTTTGNITDLDGNATIENAPGNGVLVISYIGYVTREVAINNQAAISVTLAEDSQALDEVVVVGYGTQQKRDITGSVAVVSAEDLQEQPYATFAEALQGRASGVYVSSTGAPGSPTTIRIRGVGSVNGSDPLIVVDGVSGVDIDAVNPNDIETFQVLKDASATAIYGAQGANGVIIITTKQGDKGGRVRITYNGYIGTSKMANSGYDLLNANEAMEFVGKGMVNLRDYRGLTTTHAQFGSLDENDRLTMPYAIKPAGYSEQDIINQYGSVAAWEASYRDDGTNSWSRSAYAQMKLDGYSEEVALAGTNWYDQVTQSGFIQDHQLGVLGGNDKGSYSLSVGYSTREGTIKNSFFDRYTARLNAVYNATRYLTLGANMNVAVMEMGGERGFQGDDNVFGQTYTTQPWIPVYNIGGDYAGTQATEGGRANQPVMTVAHAKEDWSKFLRGQASFFAELKPIEGLTVRSQFATMLNGGWTLAFSERNIFSNKEGRTNNQLEETSMFRYDWQWTNTASYTRTIADDHNVTVVVGTEALDQNNGRSMTGTRIDYAFENDPNTWTLNNGSSSNQSNSGYMQNHTTMFGYFGRADYSYQGKYLATVSVRRDASSKFGENNRWGTFPSVSAGWRISDEAFMESTRNWLDDLKLRAGYGTTGNSNIGAYNYAFRYGTGAYYSYGRPGTDSDLTTGYGVTALGDPNAKWETVRSLNIGFDATAFNNKLTLGFEWYTRKTTDLLLDANWSSLAGMATFPSVNFGDMRNVGTDLSIGYRDRIGNVGFNVNANISTYRNKVLNAGVSNIFYSTRLANMSVITTGQPVGVFYGYEVDGIYKSEADVTNYKNAKGGSVLPFGIAAEEDLDTSAFVGRYIFKDLDGDGRITASDRTVIGNPHPDFTGGLNIGVNWNNFDLSTYFYFSVGNDIFKMYEYYTHYGALQSNYHKERATLSWHPTENPNGKYPMWAGSAYEGTEARDESHSMYIEDGSYLRMQNLTLGYSLPRNILSKIGLERVRFYGQVSNVFTLTGYTGLDPEIRSTIDNRASDRNKGVDFGAYGSPRQFIFGVNVGF